MECLVFSNAYLKACQRITWRTWRDGDISLMSTRYIYKVNANLGTKCIDTLSVQVLFIPFGIRQDICIQYLKVITNVSIDVLFFLLSPRKVMQTGAQAFGGALCCLKEGRKNAWFHFLGLVVFRYYILSPGFISILWWSILTAHIKSIIIWYHLVWYNLMHSKFSKHYIVWSCGVLLPHYRYYVHALKPNYLFSP